MALCKDRLGGDKSNHFILGAVICIVSGAIYAHFLFTAPWLVAILAVATTFVAAVVWEFIRLRKLPGNHICIWDILWSVFGAASFCWLPWLAAYLLAIDQ